MKTHREGEKKQKDQEYKTIGKRKCRNQQSQGLWRQTQRKKKHERVQKVDKNLLKNSLQSFEKFITSFEKLVTIF